MNKDYRRATRPQGYRVLDSQDVSRFKAVHPPKDRWPEDMDYPDESPIDRLAEWWLKAPGWVVAVGALLVLAIPAAIVAAWIVY